MTAGLLWAFLRRDAAIQVSYRSDLALQFASAIFTLTLFFYLGELVDASALADDAGFDGGYFAFAIVGIALLQIMQTGLVSFANRLRQEQLTGTFEALMAAPVSPAVVIVLTAVFDLVRATVVGLVLIVVSVAIFGLSLSGGLVGLAAALVVLIGALTLFSALGVLLASFGLVYKQTITLVGMTVTGLALLSGVYFPLEVLPEPLSAVGELLPFTWAVDAMRAALLSGEVEIGRLSLLFASAIVLMATGFVIFRLAFDRARRDGSLSQY